MTEAAIISRFRVEARLGQGGMGEVYRAWDTVLARPVALKWVRGDRRDDASASRFLREARAAAGLRHPNIVTIYDLGSGPEGTYLVMELLDGRPLGAAMEDGAFSLVDKLGWLREIGAALAAAHAAGIVHRDVKPSNVVLCRDGHVKVVDFGLAKPFGLAPLASTSTWTERGAVVGTPLYMAPEQSRGDAADPRVDQFAWGAVGYELVHGQRWAPALRDHAAPAGAPPDALAVLRRATEPQPTDRFPSMAEAVRALEASLGVSSPAPIEAATITQPPWDPPAPPVVVSGLLGTAIGNYTLVERIGRGGMGDVFRAVNPSLGAVVAIKVLNMAGNGDAARFLTEARAVNRIAHDGVVKILDGGYLDGGRPYLVMELLDGESLAQQIARGPLEPVRAVAILDEVLGAVAAAHAAQIVHRDLKPENIFLADGGRVRLLDFGVAKVLDEADSMTRTGTMVGTPHYMAPEQIQAGQVDRRTDLYALGVVLFEMLAGTKPFDGPTAFAIVQAHVGASIPRLPAGLPPHLDAVVARALAKQPDDRFASAEEMRAALHGGVVARPRRRAALAIGLVVVAAGAVAVVALAWPRGGSPRTAIAQPPLPPVDAPLLAPAVDAAVPLAPAVDAAVVVDATAPPDARPRVTPPRTPAAHRIKYGGPLAKNVISGILWGDCPNCDGPAFNAEINASYALFAPCFAATIYIPPLHSDPKFVIDVSADGEFGAAHQWYPKPPHPQLTACIERAMRSVPLVKHGGGAGSVELEFSAWCPQAFANGQTVWDRCGDD
jgi:serine/threonine-protein kinase